MQEQEPSLLDYLKDKLDLRRILRREPPRYSLADTEPAQEFEKAQIHASPEDDFELDLRTAGPKSFVETIKGPAVFPWRSLLAFFIALVAQSQLEPPAQDAMIGIIFYTAAAGLLVWSLIKKEWLLPPSKEYVGKSVGLQVRTIPLFIFLFLLIASFISFKDNHFTVLNVTLWAATLIFGLLAFWERDPRPASRGFREKIKGSLNLWNLLVLAVFLLAAWFHLYHLDTIPLNMTSDHTEKLLDINSVLRGSTDIFFMNNGGREPIQFYMAAFIVKVFHLGLNFLTLKLTMALAFLVSLIYIYRLGKEVGTRWTGLLFLTLFGFAAWPNMIARVGLRVVLTPVFVAPVMFYLLRGLRSARRNDFVLAGILTGLGLLGYSAFRLMPFVVLVGVVLFVIYHRFHKPARSNWWALGVLILFAFVMALPLLRFAVDYPNVFGYRTLTRLTSLEVQLQGSAAAIFFSNLWKCLFMPFWKDGNTWVISVMNRPGLDIVSAAFYFIGLILVVWRWLRSRSWQDLFLLVSIPLLMLPSILALAFPDENPSLSRAGGAAVPIILIATIGLEGLLISLWKQTNHWGARTAVAAFGLMLIGLSAAQNYEIALKQYPDEYVKNTWNTTQMGQVASDFIKVNGNPDNVWVVGVPYWVDTRLVAISAGYIGRDYAIWADDLETTFAAAGAKLFIVKDNDLEGMSRLQELYPQGNATLHTNEVEGRNFYAFVVPAG